MNSTTSPPPSLTTMNGASNSHTTSSWVDEFLDFSSHRRSISDSIAFLDQPLAEGCTTRQPPSDNSNGILTSEPKIGFNRLDDDHLMSMFSDDISPSLPPAVSLSSDQNSKNDEKTAITDHRDARGPELMQARTTTSDVTARVASLQS
ncbi:hypothetical protein SLEP1_g27077 [Rubroshorea leprosula]|uniref:Uncharacterized protein n=1 Tax=Rubroshorea leprosula TaxID=152421 RepID=A0AAV5K1T4_9ROSI|nr:hypothetical protein SLEP1_g27077 [Rubroshorea leprosula]